MKSLPIVLLESRNVNPTFPSDSRYPKIGNRTRIFTPRRNQACTGVAEVNLHNAPVRRFDLLRAVMIHKYAHAQDSHLTQNPVPHKNFQSWTNLLRISGLPRL